METIKVMAAAKVNLTLEITSKRSDGYHEIKSIMQSVGLFDTVTLSQNSSGKITVSCSRPEIPCDDTNIVCKCAKTFFEKIKKSCDGLHIDIQKDIPSQAGLAGGSADGAAVIIGLNELCGRPFSQSELEELGGASGADIPFCIRGGTVLCEGIGTTLTPVKSIPDCWFVLVKPPVGVSTAQAYKAVDSNKYILSDASNKMLAVIDDITKIGNLLHNDFEKALNIGELLSIKKELCSFEGALGACMSGSGSTVFALFSERDKAAVCAEAFKERFKDVFVVPAVSFGTKPITSAGNTDTDYIIKDTALTAL